MSELKTEVIDRITRLAGLDLDKDKVRNPCITARESIVLADHMDSLRREVEELKGDLRELHKLWNEPATINEMDDDRIYGVLSQYGPSSALAEDTRGGGGDDRA